MDFAIRPALPADAPAVASVVAASFEQLSASSWTPDAARAFLAEASAPSLDTKIRAAAYAAVAEVDGRVVAFALLPRPSLLAMLFVHPTQLRKGIGQALWEAARAHLERHHPDTRTVELNSTPYALSFYANLGFFPISKEFVFEGARATRMALWLPARALESGTAPRSREAL